MCLSDLDEHSSRLAELFFAKVDMRLQPHPAKSSQTDFDPLRADPYPLYNYLLKELNQFNLLYIHMVEPRIGKQMNVIEVDNSKKSLKPFKKLSNASFIAAGG